MVNKHRRIYNIHRIIIQDILYYACTNLIQLNYIKYEMHVITLQNC